ncbi:MAG: glycosyltransferase, partial [Selenomonadaceae bacterium]|nr:glycosyltransferase [Selenomonadaceae bacterium]
METKNPFCRMCGIITFSFWRLSLSPCIQKKVVNGTIGTLDYYYTCIDILKHRYNNITVFVFSDNLPWLKENLRLDVPMEFVEGVETDNEECVLMSLCKHNICAISTFSKMATALNSNPDKKVFLSNPSNTQETEQFYNGLTPDKKEYFLNNTYIRIPFDCNNQPDVTMRPFFSLLFVMNNDAATIADTLDSLFYQDYKHYEVIIIDNASTDGSRAICRQKIEGRKNVTFKKLHTKVNNAKAWNIALRMAQGYYVSFLKSNGGNALVFNALTKLYLRNYNVNADILHLFSYFEQNDSGRLTFAGKKYSPQRDVAFKEEKRDTIIENDGKVAVQLLINQQINSFLGTKIFYRRFLEENK